MGMTEARMALPTAPKWQEARNKASNGVARNTAKDAASARNVKWYDAGNEELLLTMLQLY